MINDYIIIPQVKLFSVEYNTNFLADIPFKDIKEIDSLSFQDLTLEKKEEIINYLNADYSKNNPSNSILVKDPYLYLNGTEGEKRIIKLLFKFKSQESYNKKKIFKVNYPEKSSLFTNVEKDNLLIEGEKENTNNILEKKRKRISRKENKDNIRRKIKRGFLNSGIIPKLNQKLKNYGSKLYFMKFPQSFVSDIFRKTNKEIVNMTLEEIFKNKNIIKDKKDLKNYSHNLKVIQNEEIKKIEELQKILNMKYCNLFEEFINSDEFKIDEINRIKKKNANDEFIKKFINVSQHFIEFFSQ